jgi:hypothetical protein
MSASYDMAKTGLLGFLLFIFSWVTTGAALTRYLLPVMAMAIQGIGFKTADQIAQKIGIPVDSLIRVWPDRAIPHSRPSCS